MAALRSSLLVVCTSLVAAATNGQVLVRQGVEFQINEVTIDSQSGPAAAFLGDGDFVVVWRSKEQDGAAYGVFARRFDATGQALGGDFQVNTYTPTDQMYPRVAAAADGGFVVVWQSTGQDAFGMGVFGRRFDAASAPLAAEFQLTLQTVNDQRHPVISTFDDGSFVMAWESQSDGFAEGIFARRFASDGEPLAPQFQVNVLTYGNQVYPSIAVGDDGEFLVAWHDYRDQDALSDIFARRFDHNGPVGDELQVNSLTLGRQIWPAAARDRDGDFVVVWRSFQSAGNDGIFARRFDDAAVPMGPEFRINPSTAGNQIAPAVIGRPAGGFVVAWSQQVLDGGAYGSFGRILDSSGALSAQFQINTYTPASQLDPALAVDAAGDFVIAWSSDQQDHSERGIFAQRFAEPAVLDIDADGEVDALTDGILVLRFLFGFTGETLIGGAVGPQCERCEAPAIESYLESLV